jgi:glycosyltransferase involved in cell wall biosynthesis
MKSKVSIIIPTFNRSDLLSRSIKSILNQTYKNWELIIIDDGSTDNTKEVVESFIKLDSRIFYKYQNNSGGNASPKNLGLKICSGDYITFLDSDDEYLPEKIRLQLEIFETSNVKNLGFVGCNNLRIFNDIIKTDIVKHRGNIYRHLLDHYFITTPGIIMLKKEVIKIVGNFDENIKFSNDTDFFIRVSKSGFGFDFVNEFLFKYYEHEKSFTNTFQLQNKKMKCFIF